MQDLEYFNEERERLLDKRNKLQAELDRTRDALKSAQKHYRVHSVNRVLDFVRRNCDKLSKHDIDTLLCHCQNKLNGNIDGIELALDINHYVGKPITKEDIISGND